MAAQANPIVTTQYTGNKSFPQYDREYFFIVMTSGAGTIAFGPSGAGIPLEEGFHYAPGVVPSELITVVTSGTYIVHSDQVVA